jgi:hypothetical protein
MKEALLVDDTVSPRDLYRRVLERWPRLIVWAILGALAFCLYSQAAPRRFLASASVNVDQNAEVVVPLGDESRMASYLNRETLRLETLAYSDPIWAEVARGLALEGFLARPGDIDRIFEDVQVPHPMDGEWRFTAYSGDPALAARTAQLWAEAFVRHADQAVRIAREEQALRTTIASRSQALGTQESRCVELRGLSNSVAGTSTHLETLAASAPSDPQAAEELRYTAEAIELACGAFEGCSAPQTVSDQRAFAGELAARIDTRLEACTTVRDLLRESLNVDSVRWQALVDESLGVSPFMEVVLLRNAEPPSEPVVQTGWFAVAGAFVGIGAWAAWEFLLRRGRGL